jgi:hypothetical protein
MIRGVLFLAALIAWLTMGTSMIAIAVCAIAATRNRLPDAPRHGFRGRSSVPSQHLLFA